MHIAVAASSKILPRYDSDICEYPNATNSIVTTMCAIVNLKVERIIPAMFLLLLSP
jgi:hypothetical protein